MNEIQLEQLVYGGYTAGGYRFLARSPGFAEEWLPEAERICTGFGERPAGASCPACVFAQPFGRQHVAVVQVADQGTDDAGRPGALGFHLVILERDHYAGLGGDPFAIADRCPPPWSARGDLATLTWPAEPLPPRHVEDVQRVLKRQEGPVLLGGAQVLVDGGRLVFERPAPDTELMRGLWTLLPTSTRSELWPASFAFSNTLRFHSLVVPPGKAASAEEFPHYVTEEEAGDYPEGRYELNLQIAAEAGNQHDLDLLFARRSRSEVWRLGLFVLAVVLVLPILIHLLTPETPEEAPHPRPATTRPTPKLDLPTAEPTLTPEQRTRWLAELRAVAEQIDPEAVARLQRGQGALPAMAAVSTLGVPAMLPLSAVALAAPEDTLLLAAIDRKWGTPDPQRNPGPLYDQGPPLRQLRVLLWKHGVKDYNDPGLNYSELLDRLRTIINHEGHEGTQRRNPS